MNIGKQKLIAINRAFGITSSEKSRPKKKYVTGSEPLYKGLQNILLKGGFSELRDFSDTKFAKTGKQIREKLIALKAENEMYLVECKTKKEELKKAIGVEPDEEAYSYEYEGIPRSKIGEIPKRYSWELRNQICNERYSDFEQKAQNINAQMGDESGREKIQELQREYNGLKNKIEEYNHYVRRYMEYVANIVTINTFIECLKDGTSYSLNLSQLRTIGF